MEKWACYISVIIEARKVNTLVSVQRTGDTRISGPSRDDGGWWDWQGGTVGLARRDGGAGKESGAWTKEAVPGTEGRRPRQSNREPLGTSGPHLTSVTAAHKTQTQKLPDVL